jgi:hypothetical protein
MRYDVKHEMICSVIEERAREKNGLHTMPYLVDYHGPPPTS